MRQTWTDRLTRHFGEAGVRFAIRLGSGTLVITALTSILMLLSTIVLARSMDPAAFADISFVLAVVNVCLIFAQFGLPNFALRWTARFDADEDWDGLRSVWAWIAGALAVSTLLTTTAYLIVTHALGEDLRPELVAAIVAGAWLIPILALTNVLGYMLRGLRAILIGQIIVSLPRHAGTIALTLLFVAVTGSRLDATTGLTIQVVSVTVGVIVAVLTLYAKAPIGVLVPRSVRFESRPWLVASATLAAVTGFQILNKNMDVVGLGVLGDENQTGVYKVAAQLSLMISFGLSVVNTAVAPWMSRLHTQNRIPELQRLITGTVLAVMLIAIPAVGTLVLFGREILTLLFGPTYETAYIPLVVLCFGQLVNTIFGPVGLLLNMTGHERLCAMATGAATVANLILLLTLIPLFGTFGAALATALTFVLWNFILWRVARNTLSIDTSIFAALGFFGARRQ